MVDTVDFTRVGSERGGVWVSGGYWSGDVWVTGVEERPVLVGVSDDYGRVMGGGIFVREISVDDDVLWATGSSISAPFCVEVDFSGGFVAGDFDDHEGVAAC